MPSDATTTILQAAANLMRQDALDRVRAGKGVTDNDLVNAALLAYIATEKYLKLLAALDRPF